MPIRLLRLIKRKLGLAPPVRPADATSSTASGRRTPSAAKPSRHGDDRPDVVFQKTEDPRTRVRGDEWKPAERHAAKPSAPERAPEDVATPRSEVEPRRRREPPVTNTLPPLRSARREERPAPPADAMPPPRPERREERREERRDERRVVAPPAPTPPAELWDPAQFEVPETADKKRFHDFALPAEIMHAIQDLGFRYCTPIQAETLGLTMAGRNVAGRAQTGTGKTAAFLITVLRRMLHDPASRPTVPGRPAALVIGPTRELVIQIASDAELLGKYCGLRCVAVYGGMDYAKQQEQIAAGPVDLMVATPGRLLDFRSTRVVDLKGVHTLVIDEADRMLDMGFIPDVRKIINALPEREKRQTMLFSATLTEDVMKLASQWMPDPVQVAVEPENATVSTITQLIYPIASREKFTVLYNLLQREKAERVLVFCNRRIGCERLMTHLLDYGIPCEMLSGDVAQKKRLRVLDDFRSGKVKVVVATDVAGRGIHVDDIAYVVNFDFPYEADDYIHRIGRTGRAGNIGTAISFACEDESFIIPDIEKLLGKDLPCAPPPDELLVEPPRPANRRHHEVAAEDRAVRHDDRRGGGHGGPRRSGPPRGR